MIRNQSGQVAGAQVNDASTGLGYTGLVTVYIIGDGVELGLGTVNSGVAESDGGGYYTYNPTAAETNFATVAFQFRGATAVTSATTYDTFTIEQNAAVSAATSGIGMSCRDLLVACLRRIGVVGQGVTAKPEDLQTALIAFNSFVDACAANNLLLYGESRSTWALVSGQQDYLVGPGQDVDRARPVYVEQFGGVSPIRFIDTDNGSVEVPLTFLSNQEWRAVSLKSMDNTLPSCAFYDPTFPYSTIKLWPVPSASSLVGVLYAGIAMPEYDFFDVISLPPGYRRFLITNVAMELCPEFDRKPPDGLAAMAQQAKADVERSNMRLTDMAIDPMWSQHGAGVYNIYSDTPNR